MTRDAFSGWLVLASALLLFDAVVFFLVIPLGLSRLFPKLGATAARGWAPFANLAKLYELGGYSGWWLVSLFFPVADVVGAVMLIVACHNVGRRLGKGGGMTVLAVFLFPVWALVVGFDRSREVNPAVVGGAPLVYRVALPEPTPEFAPAPAPVPAPERPAVVPSSSTPDAAPSAPVPVAPVPPPSAPSTSAPSIPAPSTPDPAAPTAAAPAPPPAFTGSLFGSPPTAHDDYLADETVITGPSRRSVEPEEDPDETVSVRRRRASWFLETANGQRVELLGAAVLLGRRPQASPAQPEAQAIVLDDPEKTVSGTHALLELFGEDWTVTDLDSTNGVELLDGEAYTAVPPRTRTAVTGDFRLGDLVVRIMRQS